MTGALGPLLLLPSAEVEQPNGRLYMDNCELWQFVMRGVDGCDKSAALRCRRWPSLGQLTRCTLRPKWVNYEDSLKWECTQVQIRGASETDTDTVRGKVKKSLDWGRGRGVSSSSLIGNGRRWVYSHKGHTQPFLVRTCYKLTRMRSASSTVTTRKNPKAQKWTEASYIPPTNKDGATSRHSVALFQMERKVAVVTCLLW